jgi:hypothetical protein
MIDETPEGIETAVKEYDAKMKPGKGIRRYERIMGKIVAVDEDTIFFEKATIPRKLKNLGQRWMEDDGISGTKIPLN